jgi:hypothetical protein
METGPSWCEVALSDWNWRHPVELQDVPWDCAAASTAWALQAAGLAYTEADVVAGLGPTRISPAYGLLDASGAGLVEWLGSIGVGADNDADATWQEVLDAAGHQPMVMGGRAWCHWTGVRIASTTLRADLPEIVALANPAPGYDGIGQLMYPLDFQRLGSFSAVWFTSW